MNSYRELKRPKREANQSPTYMFQDEEREIEKEESDQENTKERRKEMMKGQ
jgi:hypothetical protein